MFDQKTKPKSNVAPAIASLRTALQHARTRTPSLVHTLPHRHTFNQYPLDIPQRTYTIHLALTSRSPLPSSFQTTSPPFPIPHGYFRPRPNYATGFTHLPKSNPHTFVKFVHFNAYIHLSFLRPHVKSLLQSASTIL